MSAAVFEENEVVETVVVGFRTCPFYQEALGVAATLKDLAMTKSVTKKEFETRAEFKSWLPEAKSVGISGEKYLSHTSSPFIYAVTKDGEKQFIGEFIVQAVEVNA